MVVLLLLEVVVEVIVEFIIALLVPVDDSDQASCVVAGFLAVEA